MTMVSRFKAEIECMFLASSPEERVVGSSGQSGSSDSFDAICTKIGAKLREDLIQVFDSVSAEDLPAFEGAAMKAAQVAVQATLKARFESLDDGARHVVRGGKRYRRVASTPHTVMTSVGPVGYSRPRYRSACGASLVPVDEQVCFGDSHFTERAAEQTMFLLSELSPRDCMAVYGRLGVEGPSVSSLQRLASEAHRQWNDCAEDALAAMRVSEGVPVEAASVCISLDGVHLPMIPGEKGSGTATIWKEASVATLSFYDTAGDRMHTVYLGEMPEPRKVSLKQRLEEELAHVTAVRPDLQVVAVADAAADNWSFLSTQVPEAFQLIDFFHVAQHLGAAARHIFPRDDAARSTWYEKYRKLLRHDPVGAEKVIRSLRYYWVKRGNLKDGLQSELKYFRNHANRMDYARLSAMNLPIGSGVTEAACKTLVNSRMKRSGQRWGMKGGKAVLIFRALVKSKRFDAAWSAIADHTKALRANNDNRSSRLHCAAA